MENTNFHTTITVNASPQEVTNKISQVNLWWAKNFTGDANEVNDKFTVRFGETYVDFQIREQIPGKKVAWKVTDCNLPWINNKKEWKNTEVLFEIAPREDGSRIDFTHVGLVPGIECYENCEEGWTGFITESLPKFIDEGRGMPE